MEDQLMRVDVAASIPIALSARVGQRVRRDEQGGSEHRNDLRQTLAALPTGVPRRNRTVSTPPGGRDHGSAVHHRVCRRFDVGSRTDVARSLLAHHLKSGVAPPPRIYQAFKVAVVATLPRATWTLTGEQIRASAKRESGVELETALGLDSNQEPSG
jgi:hypothetical protein